MAFRDSIGETSGAKPIRSMVRNWAAELEPFPNRWRRAARVAFVTAIGAGLMAALQISNPLGLTLLVSFALPEFAFSLDTGIAFLLAAAAIQWLMLAIVGALVDSPVAHVSVFLIFVAVTTYLIYGLPRLGRLWLWIQIPAVTAFYMVLFDRHTLGWDNAQMFAGVAIAVALLWLFNNILWPEPAAAVLAESLRSTMARSRRRLNLLVAIFVGERAPDSDRAVASKLAYHLSLLQLATGKARDARAAAELLAHVMVAERIHNEIDRLFIRACSQAGAAYGDAQKRDLIETVAALDIAIGYYIPGIDGVVEAEREELIHSLNVFNERNAQQRLSVVNAPALIPQLEPHLIAIGDLLSFNSAELPNGSLTASASRRKASSTLPLNRFLVRFCARHTVAMTIAFVAGLFDNSAAIHAALWLLMIGGPPSHGATAKKFTMRAIGASGALLIAALGTILLAPNFTTIPPYIAIIFIGVLPMIYLGQAGGELSYLAISATAFVIAFSGPGPRADILGSIWTIWGISLGMIIRAIVSMVSIERPNRTLAEEMEGPLAALVALVPDGVSQGDEIAATEMEVIAGIEGMLSVAADAQLQGGSIGIDARELVDALDTMRRIAFALGNLTQQHEDDIEGIEEAARTALAGFDQMMVKRINSWLSNIRAQLEPGRLTEAPLRTMVSNLPPDDLAAELEPLKLSRTTVGLGAREHLTALIGTLERQMAKVSLS